TERGAHRNPPPARERRVRAPQRDDVLGNLTYKDASGGRRRHRLIAGAYRKKLGAAPAAQLLDIQLGELPGRGRLGARGIETPSDQQPVRLLSGVDAVAHLAVEVHEVLRR